MPETFAAVLEPGRFAKALRESVNAALEEMFFATDLAPCDVALHAPGAEITAGIAFSGLPSGRLLLRISMAGARTMAADFLGEDASSIGASEAASVFAELANIVCGGVLTRTEPDCVFRLSSPRVSPAEETNGEPTATSGNTILARYAVLLDEGPLFAQLEGDSVRMASE